MGKIIAAAGHKGGPGKSTLIISIGVFLAKKGKSVCWLETDKQGSLQDFVESRKETGITPEIPLFRCFTDIAAKAKKLATKFDYVLLDSPGQQSAEFMKSIVCADIVLTFADPASSIETNTLGKVVYDIKTAQAGLNPHLKGFIVLNKCDTDPRDTEASEFRKLLNADPDWLPVTRQRIYYRKAHKKAYNNGMGVHEYNDKCGNKARGEIELLIKEIDV